MANPRTVAHLQEFGGRQVEINRITQNLIGQTLAEGVLEGEGIVLLSERIQAVFEAASKRRSRTIARTEVNASANFTNIEAFRQSGIVERKQWIATLDDRVREAHDDLDGVIENLDTDFDWQGNTADRPGAFGIGELDINCFLPYTGEAVEIKTAGGNRLCVTPNHPIATPQGFVPAHALTKGDNLLSYTGKINRTLGGVSQYINKNPAPIEQVFSTLSDALSSVAIGPDAVNFHGDAAAMQGEVQIVRPDRMLLSDRDIIAAQQIKNLSLIATNAGQVSLGTSGPLNLLLQGNVAVGSSLPSGGTLPHSLGPSHFGPLQEFRFGPAAQLHTGGLETRTKTSASNASGVADLLQRFPSEITLDQVVEIRNFAFRGHVYDLQTVEGWMVSSGIVASNCRCTTIAVFADVGRDFASRRRIWKINERRKRPWELEAAQAFKVAFAEQEEAALAELKRVTA
jgi:SPP1 gp7 family putative phage head morphogenesis protein